MSVLDNVRRKRTSMILGMNVLAVIAVGVIGLIGVNALRNYEGAKKVGQEFKPLPITSVGMLAIVNAENRLSGITVVATLPGDQAGGYLLPLPTSVDTSFGIGDERIALTAVYASGGPEALAEAVESALSVTLDMSQVFTPEEAAAILEPVAPATAELPISARATVDGVETVVFESGTHELSAAEMVQVLTAEVAGEVESARRDNLNAVWAAIANSVGQGRTNWVAGTPVTGLADLLTRVFSGPVTSRPFPTLPIAPELNPQGFDVEAIDRPEAVMALATVAPGSMSSPSLGLAYRIEAPPGYVDEVKTAIGALLYYGANVRSVDFNGPVLEFSLALLNNENARSAVAEDNALFGQVDVAVNPLPIEGIDVVLQLGSDYLGRAASVVLPSTTVLP